MVEVACVAVSPEMRSTGRGQAMLNYLIRRSSQIGHKKMFALSTRATHFFLELGFVEAQVADLPPSKIQRLHAKKHSDRNSKIYMFDIPSERDLNEAELFSSINPQCTRQSQARQQFKQSHGRQPVNSSNSSSS